MHFDIMLQAFERGHNVTIPLTNRFTRTYFFFLSFFEQTQPHGLVKNRVLNLAKSTINNQA